MWWALCLHSAQMHQYHRIIPQIEAEAKLFSEFFITKIILKKRGVNLRSWLPEVVPRTVEGNLKVLNRQKIVSLLPLKGDVFV